MRTSPPAGAAKSVRWVSIRPEVQLPGGVPDRLDDQVAAAVLVDVGVLLVIVSTSPVPQLAAPPG